MGSIRAAVTIKPGEVAFCSAEVQRAIDKGECDGVIVRGRNGLEVVADFQRIRIVMIPSSAECTLAECAPGFFVHLGRLCFKSEYRQEGKIEAFNSAGEYFWGGTNLEENRTKILVQPVKVINNDTE